MPLGGQPSFNPTRRQLLKTAMAAGLAAVGWPILEPFTLQLEQVDVVLPDLPPSLHGLRIALLSDMHVGNFAGPALVTKAVAMANRTKPDLVLLGGDMVHDWVSEDDLHATAKELGHLRAPLGTFGVLGNHDYAAGGPRVQAALEDAGVPMLLNTGRRFRVGESELWLAGLDDVWNGQPDLPKALKGSSENSFKVLLVHEPDYADEAVRLAHDRINLQCSGHSHGGQVRLPFLGALALPHMSTRYPIGLQQVPGHRLKVYTSRGIGVTGLPVRFLCPPEVTLLRLRRG